MRIHVAIAIALHLLMGVAACAPVASRPAYEAHEAWLSLPPTPALPTPERQGHVEVDGSRLWYGEYGLHNGGVPVLLLHGGLANSSYYGRVIPVLVAQGYRVIAMDSRGHGRSSASSRPYSYRLMAQDVVALLDALGVAKADVVGWSDGGTTGYMLAITAPDRIGRLLTFGANAMLAGLKPDYATSPTFVAYIARTEREYLALSPDPRGYSAFLEAISSMWQSEPMENPEALGAIRIPVTIVIAQHDEAMTIAHARYLAECIPGAHLVVLPAVSHFGILQNPAAFNKAVLAFLRRD